MKTTSRVNGMDKHFVGVGRMSINTMSSTWKIPNLHFMLNKTPAENYEATNLEFILDTTGHTPQEAIQNLAGLTVHHINEVMKTDDGFDLLIEAVDTCAMEDYWREYRRIDFSLAKNGKNLGSSKLSQGINETIQRKMEKDLIGRALDSIEHPSDKLKFMASFDEARKQSPIKGVNVTFFEAKAA